MVVRIEIFISLVAIELTQQETINSKSFITARPSTLFNLRFTFYSTENKKTSRIQTRIIEVEGKDADHYTTTLANIMMSSGQSFHVNLVIHEMLWSRPNFC